MRYRRATGAWGVVWAGTLAAGSGCTQQMIDSTDRQVYELISERQCDAIDNTSHLDLGPEDGDIGPRGDMYAFTPRPVENELPAGFAAGAGTLSADEPAPVAESAVGGHDDEVGAASEARPDVGPAPAAVPERGGASEPGAEQEPGAGDGTSVAPEADAAAAPQADADDDESIMSPEIFTPEELLEVRVFKLSDALGYAAESARNLQDAKEDLYLAALDLTLERHLWTPQWVASLSGEFADYGQVRDFDRAMTLISDVAVSQRLPYGGEVTARIVNRLMRDLGEHITSGESGDLILSANIPLFRGAGRVAYESRYQAERELIYAVRLFERFRRTFLVDIAGDYFDLQQAKARVTNAHRSYLSRRDSWRRAEMIHKTRRARSVDDLPRARSSFRSAESALVSAKESYETALDRFKIRIGMEVDALLDVVDQGVDPESRSLEALLPETDEKAAVQVALQYRLDLLTSADQVDDARRGVVIAKNRILPDLDVVGSVSMATNPNELNSMSYHTDRTTWRGLIELRMDDRKAERTDYRASLVLLRRAERAHDQFTDTVRSDVRRGLRRVLQQRDIRQIQEMNVAENAFRHAAAKARFDLGESTNQDVVDADEDLLRARNDLAAAVADYRLAILEFRRDTGSLRITPDGGWIALPLDTGP